MSTIWHSLICNLTSNSFDKITADSRHQEGFTYQLFYEISCGYNIKEVNDSFMKKFDHARIKSENRLVLAYQAILSSGVPNSANFQPI